MLYERMFVSVIDGKKGKNNFRLVGNINICYFGCEFAKGYKDFLENI